MADHIKPQLHTSFCFQNSIESVGERVNETATIDLFVLIITVFSLSSSSLSSPSYHSQVKIRILTLTLNYVRYSIMKCTNREDCALIIPRIIYTTHVLPSQSPLPGKLESTEDLFKQYTEIYISETENVSKKLTNACFLFSIALTTKQGEKVVLRS